MKLRRSRCRMVLEALSLAMTVGMTVYFIVIWKDLPETVPTHYDFSGNVDGYGPKSRLLILPVMAWVIYLSLTAVRFFPKIWNTGVTVTDENRDRVYGVLANLMCTEKLLVVAVLCSLAVFDPPFWYVLGMFALTAVNTAFWLVRLNRAK